MDLATNKFVVFLVHELGQTVIYLPGLKKFMVGTFEERGEAGLDMVTGWDVSEFINTGFNKVKEQIGQDLQKWMEDVRPMVITFRADVVFVYSAR